jgi:beta-N-acetylhexosaminidase
VPASSSRRSSTSDSGASRATLEQLAASVLCVGFDGATPAAAPLDELAHLAPGGVVLFARNTTSLEQTRALTDAVRDAVEAASARAPFVAMDQEGGTVARLRAGAHEIPAMMALGASRDEELAERVGRLLAYDLARAGVDIDFAPVVDLALHAQAGVVGTRAFGDDPNAVALLGAAVVRGLESGGVAATLKHFPGHGATVSDSHDTLPVVDASARELQERDLVPFAAGMRAGASAVMAAHVVVRAYDTARPATLSRAVLEDVLRGTLGFTGACFTDCMEMEAMAGTAGTVRGAVLALAAGADCVLVSHRLALAREARDAIVAAVESGALPLARLQQAAARVAHIAARPRPSDLRADLDAGREAATRAITLVRSAHDALPLRAPVVVVTFEGEAAHGARDAARPPSLSLALRQCGVHSESFRVGVEPDAKTVAHLLEALRAQGERTVAVVMRRAHLHALQRDAVRAILAFAPQAVLVSAREPFDVALFPQARTVLCTYGDGAEAIDAAAAVLAGRAHAPGRLPVAIAP